MSPRTVILCGGKGTRAYPVTLDLPKPLLPVGDRPILRHVMDIYAGQGFTDFVLAAGHLAELIHDFAETVPPEWRVEVLDTGAETDTGDRIRRCLDVLGDTFFATYGDGLGNVDLHALTKAHEAHGGSGTLTTVPLPSQYGTVDIDDTGRVRRFLEKPVLSDHWINAGFFVFDRPAFDVDPGPNLERDVLPALARVGTLGVHRHSGFWRSMDTHKESVELGTLAAAGTPPWMPGR